MKYASEIAAISDTLLLPNYIFFNAITSTISSLKS